MTRQRFVWRLRQLLPLTYRTHYGLVKDDGTVEPHFCVWRMWMGRSFDITDVVVAK
jgi:hypothetical protein